MKQKKSGLGISQKLSQLTIKEEINHKKILLIFFVN